MAFIHILDVDEKIHKINEEFSYFQEFPSEDICENDEIIRFALSVFLFV